MCCGIVRVKCLAQEHNTVTLTVRQPGPLDSDAIACLPLRECIAQNLGHKQHKIIT